ncbi:MAG: DMT family transporter [Pseudomonadota bacterium]
MTDTTPILAAILILGAMAVIGLVDNFVVIIAETHGLWQFHILRTSFALPMIWVISRVGVGTLRPVSWRATAWRSGFVSASMVLYFGCLAFLPIAEVAAGLFTSPIWVLLISVMLFGRRIGLVRISASLVGFLGVVLVLKPDAGGLTLVSVVPVIAGLLYAVSSVMTREYCAGEGTLVLLAGSFLGLAAWGVIAMAALWIAPLPTPDGAAGFVTRLWTPLDLRFLSWVAVQAVGALVGVSLLIRAYQLAETSFVSVFEFSFLVFASFWAFVLRGEGLDPLAAIGIAMIIGSGATIALRGR